ncbi:MAG TPA: hypothetical protein PLB01_17890 [Thermoanaerobaculia bacterium]|nr:hypothetical protein [Thermoanaerobaculia bacterium]
MSRGAWIFAGLGLAFIAFLTFVMGKALDTKAPIRIDRAGASSPEPARTPTAEETAARETAEMRAIVAARAPSLARRAADQAFSGEEAARARCTFTGATPVSRDGVSAYWNAEFSCVDPQASGSFPNLTSVSVRLRLDGERWVLDD